MKIPVLRTVAECFSGAIAALRVLPLHFTLLVAVLFVLELFTGAVQSRSSAAAADRDLVREVLGLLQTLALVPFSIAVHRFLLLGERMPLLAPLSGNRFFRYSALSFGLSLFFLVPSLVEWLGVSQGLAGFFALAAVIFGLILLLACTPWFAAIAVDDPSASFSNSAQATRGNRWRMFAIILLLLLAMIGPLALTLAVRYADAGEDLIASPLTALGILSYALSALVFALIAPLFVALANISYCRLWPRSH
jgi:hypothetical protein